jgi:hypothetical protein
MGGVRRSGDGESTEQGKANDPLQVSKQHVAICS